MKFTINIKCLNPDFDVVLADKLHNGEETEDNIKYLWEDEFVVKGDVLAYRVKNKVDFDLRGYFPNGEEFKFQIPDCTIVEVDIEDGSLGQFPVSRKLVHKTDKIVSKNGSSVFFELILKGSKEIANPMDGAYFLEEDFPRELISSDDSSLET